MKTPDEIIQKVLTGAPLTDHNYGGRGIRVCARWSSFSAFYADVGPRPSRHHTLDRIDVNGDYEPGNVKWSTNVEQSRNKRGLNAQLLYVRTNKSGTFTVRVRDGEIRTVKTKFEAIWTAMNHDIAHPGWML